MLSRFKASTWRMIASGLLGLALVSGGAAGIFAQHHASASATNKSFSLHRITGPSSQVRMGEVNLATMPAATAAQIKAAGAVTNHAPTNRALKSAAQLAAERAYALAHPGALPKAAGATLRTSGNSYGGGLTPLMTSSHDGITFTQSGCNCTPPDQAIAAAPGYVFEGVNNLMIVYNTSYGLKYGPWTPNQLFAPVIHTGAFFSDPQITFDAERAVYLITWLEIVGNNDYIDVAVSKTSTPSPLTNFRVYSLPASVIRGGSDTFCDYETLGYDYWGTYITCVDFAVSNGAFQGNSTIALRTNGLLGGSITWWIWSDVPTAVSCGTGCADPAYRLSPTIEDGVPQAEWISATDAGFLGTSTASSNLTLCALTNTHALEGSTPPTISCAYTSLGTPYDDPSNASQPSNPGTVYPGVGYKQIAYRNGQLYFALPITINCGGNVFDGIEWNIVDPQLTVIAGSTPQSVNGLATNFTEAGYWCFSNADSYMPTMMADNEGDASLVFNVSNSAIDPSIAFTGRTAPDAPSTIGQGSTFYYNWAIIGSNTNTTGRYGDYSACALTTNLVVRGIMYCAGEYGGTDIWNTWLYSLRLQ
ncbi:MAG TPA: hypothetical protein VF808_05810 [Ktedonobacterales bacterium]